MYSPFVVLPYHSSPWQWYTFDSSLTHTWPAPPPGAAVRDAAEGGAWLRIDDVVGAATAGADAAAAGVIGIAGLLFAGIAAAALDSLAPYHSFTPW